MSNLNPNVQYSLQDLNTMIQTIIDEKQYNGKVKLITTVEVGAAIVVGTIVGSPDDAD